jgi:hypothetical protein
MTLKVTLSYKGKQYVIIEGFPDDYPEESARFLFAEGNYACDCNLSMFIQQQCDEFPKLDCGETIDIVSIERED